MAAKEFTVALKAASASADHDEFITFRYPGMPKGQEFKAYRPTAEQFAVAMSIVNGGPNIGARLAGIVDFMLQVVDEEAHAYMQSRLMDRNDPFGLDELVQLLEWMVEEWSARPTEQPSGSTRSASNGGQKSRPRTTKRTSSRSA